MSDTEYQPLTGDPDLLSSKAKTYADIANAITRSVATLRKIHDVDNLKSKATAALRDSAEDVANDINKAQERYAVTAKALLTYSGVLREAQDDATAAISHVNSKQDAADTATAGAALAQQKLQDSAAPDKTTDQTAATTASDNAESAGKELAAAQGEWHAAVEKKNGAAKAAITDIVEVVDGSKKNGLQDSWWDDWGAAALDIIKTICEVAGFLSIFLSWVPILGAILVGLAILGAVITLVESIVKFAKGDGSFSDIVFAAVGVVLAAFGGKLASYLGKLTKFQAASKTMTRGDNFLNSKGFKAVFGESKAAMKSGKLKTLFKEGPGFKTMVKDVKNPFELNLGKGKTFGGKYLDGLANQWAKTANNPLGLKSIGNGVSLGQIPNGAAKVSMIVADGRSVLVTGEKLWNGPDNLFGGGEHQITLKPEGLIKLGENKLEDILIK